METPSACQDECTTMSPTENTAPVENDNMGQQADSSGEKTPKQPRKSNKSRKRASKACGNCARRKIKCDGNVPCMPCLFRGRSCQAKKVDHRRHLATILKNPEKAWAQSLKEIYGERLLRPLSEPLTPLTDLSSDHDETASVAGSPLDLDGTYLKRSELDRNFQSFCQNTHSRYPFLHLPTVQARYAGISELSLLSPNLKSSNMEHRTQISQIYVCLAIGKFSESCYANRSKRSYTSGWELYSAAVQMHGDFLMPRDDFQDPSLVPQTILLMAIYLAFIDSVDLAKRLLSVAILQLKSMGCHRMDKQENIPVFTDEQLRRVQFYCYVLERELGVGAKFPFMILDTNQDSNRPRMLSDSWLESHRKDTRNVSALWRDIEGERAANNLSASRTLATELYAKAISLTSRTLYQGSLTDLEKAPAIIENLENLVEEAERKAELVQRRQYRDGLSALDSKEEALMRIKWCYLRLLISQSVLLQPQSLNLSNNQGKGGTKLTCLYLVDKILRAFQELPNEYPKFCFPFVEYLVQAIDTGMELIADDTLLKQCYGSIIYQGFESLQEICSSTSSMSVRITRRVLATRQAIQKQCSDEPGPNNDVSSGQTSTRVQDPSEPRKSPAGLAMSENAEGKMSMCEYIPAMTYSSSPSDVPVAGVAPISALQDMNESPSQFGPIGFLEDVECESRERTSHRTSPPLYIRESGPLNSFWCDTFETEMDPATLGLSSHDNGSLFQGLLNMM